MRTKLLTARWITVGLFVAALLLRLGVIAVTRFDGLYGQDAFAYFDYTRQLWDSTLRLRPPAPFYWPLGYPALIALAFTAFGFTSFAAQLVSLISGSLVAPLVYWLTYETSPLTPQPPLPSPDLVHRKSGEGAKGEWGEAAPLIAGLIAAVSGQLLQMSIVVMADAAAIMWALVSAFAVVRYTRALQLRWLMIASLSLALAICTRWVFAALIAPWALACLVAWWRSDTRVAITHAALAVSIALPLFVVQYGALIPSTSLQHAWLVAWNPLNALGRAFDTPDGHFIYPLPVGLFYAQPLAHPFYIFPLFAPFIVAGLWALRLAPLPTRIIVVGWFIAVYIFLMGIPYENFRFGLALWPPLVVLVGVGFTAVVKRLATDDGRRTTDNERGQRKSPVSRLPSPVIWRAALIGIASLSLLGMIWWSARGLAPFIATKNEHLAIVRTVEQQVPLNSTIITIGLTEFFKHYTPDFNVVELYTQTPDTLERYVCAANPTYLLVEPESIATQWAGRDPERNVRWLREHAGLREDARFGAFTLYRVGGACA